MPNSHSLTPARNAHGEPWQVCNKCWVPHYENCCTCFGWGLRAGTMDVPITAQTAQALRVWNTEPCWECGSTTAGMPQ